MSSSKLRRSLKEDYPLADTITPLFARIVEAIGDDVFLSELRNEQDTTTQVALLPNGDVVIRHNGPSVEKLMPDWPYCDRNKKHPIEITITGGGCTPPKPN